MNNPNILHIELDPVDAMLIMSVLQMVRDPSFPFKGLTRAIDNYNATVVKNITPEQVSEANDALAMYQLLAQAGL